MSKIDEDWQGQPRGKAEDEIYLKELCELENLVYTQTVYTLKNDQVFKVI
jgi:hypothetical protein